MLERKLLTVSVLYATRESLEVHVLHVCMYVCFAMKYMMVTGCHSHSFNAYYQCEKVRSIDSPADGIHRNRVYGITRHALPGRVYCLL